MTKYSQAIASAIVELESGNKRLSWTEDTVLCKLRGCNCKGCKYKEIGCRLKKHVLDLVERLGKPEGIPEPTVLTPQEELIYLKSKYSLEILCRLYNCTRAEMKYKLKKCEEND